MSRSWPEGLSTATSSRNVCNKRSRSSPRRCMPCQPPSKSCRARLGIVSDTSLSTPVWSCWGHPSRMRRDVRRACSRPSVPGLASGRTRTQGVDVPQSPQRGDAGPGARVRIRGPSSEGSRGDRRHHRSRHGRTAASTDAEAPAGSTVCPRLEVDHGRRDRRSIRESPGPPDGSTMTHLHGFGLSGAYLVPTAELLADDFHTLVPDLPGFGRSGRSPARSGWRASPSRGGVPRRAQGRRPRSSATRWDAPSSASSPTATPSGSTAPCSSHRPVGCTTSRSPRR